MMAATALRKRPVRLPAAQAVARPVAPPAARREAHRVAGSHAARPPARHARLGRPVATARAPAAAPWVCASDAMSGARKRLMRAICAVWIVTLGACLVAGCGSLLGIGDLPGLDGSAGDGAAAAESGLLADGNKPGDGNVSGTGVDTGSDTGAADGDTGTALDATSPGDASSDAPNAAFDSGTPSDATVIPDGASGPEPIGVAAGLASACLVQSGGVVECWGDNAYGELGTGTSTGPQTCPNGPCSTTPVSVTAVTQATGVAAGDGFACALVSGGPSSAGAITAAASSEAARRQARPRPWRCPA